jgi:hypothetical protein
VNFFFFAPYRISDLSIKPAASSLVKKKKKPVGNEKRKKSPLFAPQPSELGAHDYSSEQRYDKFYIARSFLSYRADVLIFSNIQISRMNS